MEKELARIADALEGIQETLQEILEEMRDGRETE